MMLSSAGDDTELGVSDCLRFFTGAKQVPPVGFDVDSTLNFNNSSVYPTASTCPQILTLPSQYYDDYAKFKDKMLYALSNHGGFGLC